MKNRKAFAGIDVAFAKRKILPIVVCTWEEGTFSPLPLHGSKAGIPPHGQGNVKTLDQKTVAEFAESTFRYLLDVEKEFKVNIRRIAIDSPSSPKLTGMPRRKAEEALDVRGISCITTPDAQQFMNIRNEVMEHLKNNGLESHLPHANQLWMLVGFELFRRLRQKWECIEVFPHAIAVSLNSAVIHKSQSDGFHRQLSSIARYTGWPNTPSKKDKDAIEIIKKIGYGKLHDKLDSYLASWVASLEACHREALGTPPNDVIWIPKVTSLVSPERKPLDGRKWI